MGFWDQMFGNKQKKKKKKKTNGKTDQKVSQNKKQNKNQKQNKHQKNNSNQNTNSFTESMIQVISEGPAYFQSPYKKIPDTKKKRNLLRDEVKERESPKSKSSEPQIQLKKPTVSLEHFSSRLTSFNGSPVGRTMYDNCAYIILCPKHNKIMVSIEEKSGVVWLPFVSLNRKKSWNAGAFEGVNLILSNGDPKTLLSLTSNSIISESHCIQLFRLQLPLTQKFNVRIIFFVKLVTDSSNWKCCTNTKRLVWTPVEDIFECKVENLWGPEVVEYTRMISDSEAMIDNIDEYSLDEAFRYVPRDPPRNLEEEMLKSTNFTEKDVERLYTDFIEHCFPAFFMTQTSFSDYMSKYGFEKMDKKLELLFSAFNFNRNGFLNFHEFLLGLTSIDPMATNGQSRIKFLFKYYDIDSDGSLNEKEFTSMVREMNPKKNEKEIQKITRDSMNMIGVKQNGVHFDDFFKAVGAHQFRGTSVLCRSNRPILQQISRSMASRSLKRATGRLSLPSIFKDRKYKGICDSCREKRFEFAVHLVRLDCEGRCVDAQPLPELSQLESTKSEESIVKKKSTESLDISDDKTGSEVNLKSKSLTSLKSVRTPSGSGFTSLSNEKFSVEMVWNPKSLANYFIEKIRSFNQIKGTYKDNKGLLNAPEDRDEFFTSLEKLCTQMGKIVAMEERCAQVSSPAYVIGDIHGNLEDLLTLEKVLWKSFPIVSENYVFLGDYVDRGKWGLECAIYILCMKLLAPNKVVMLRGNHEVRDLQKHYTYKKECCDKYGDALGCKVWEITNQVFDKLPFCAVIDDAIYCAHGGIPCTTKLIEKINEVSADLEDPEKEAAIAWEILWSDPIGAQQFTETAELLQIRVDTARGFITNTKRGTAFLFGEEAANNFLQQNGLTHIIRAHEVPAQGFTFHFGNKCTTVFSCSHYCGNNNTSACVHIDNEKLRIVRLDTVNNAPASD